MATCRLCFGRGVREKIVARVPSGIMEPCARCLGEKRVDSNVLAHCDDAWRRTVEIGRQRVAYAHVLGVLTGRTGSHAPSLGGEAMEDALASTFTDLNVLTDELRACSGAEVTAGTGGPAWWFACRVGNALLTSAPTARLWMLRPVEAANLCEKWRRFLAVPMPFAVDLVRRASPMPRLPGVP